MIASGDLDTMQLANMWIYDLQVADNEGDDDDQSELLMELLEWGEIEKVTLETRTWKFTSHVSRLIKLVSPHINVLNFDLD